MADLVFFDTEYTTWDGAMARKWSGPGEHREIVQIGAVRVHPETFEPTSDHLDIVIKPTLNPVLSDYFINLTGITNERVADEGVSFQDGAQAFHDYMRGARGFSYGYDVVIMNDNIRLCGLERSVSFFTMTDIEAWFNALGIFRRDRINGVSVSSGTLAAAVGVDDATVPHNALGDALSVQKAVKHMVLRNNAPHPLEWFGLSRAA